MPTNAVLQRRSLITPPAPVIVFWGWSRSLHRCDAVSGLTAGDRRVSERRDVRGRTGYLLVSVSARLHGYQLRDGRGRVRVAAVRQRRLVPRLRGLVHVRLCTGLQRSPLRHQRQRLHAQVRYKHSLVQVRSPPPSLMHEPNRNLE